MTTKKNPFIQSYKKTETHTASPEKLLLMMYEGLIRFMNQAKEACEKGDNTKKIEFTDKARKIVTELRNTLNHEAADDIAKNLERLYDYLNRRLIEFVAAKETTHIVECLEITNSLYESWKEAIQSLKKNAAAAR